MQTPGKDANAYLDDDSDDDDDDDNDDDRVCRSDEHHGEGHQPDDGQDDEDGDADPLAVLLGGDHCHQLLGNLLL